MIAVCISMPLNDEAVTAAADTILSQGGKVTLRAVRTALGGGSFTSIAPLLRAWDQRRQLQLEPSRTITAPVLSALEQAAPAIWAVALEQASQRLQSQLDHRDAQLAEQQERHAEVLAVTAGMERDLAAAQVQHQLEVSTSERLRGELSTLTSSHQRLSETHGELGAQLRLLEERRATIEHERTQLHHQLDQERQLRAERERQLDQSTSEAQHLRSDLQRLSEDLLTERALLATQLTEHRAGVVRLEQQQRQLREQLEAASQAHAEIAQALAQSRERSQGLESESTALRLALQSSHERELRSVAQEREARDMYQHLSRQYADMAKHMGDRLDAIQLAMVRPVPDLTTTNSPPPNQPG